MCVIVKTWQIRRHPCRARSSRNNGTTTTEVGTLSTIVERAAHIKNPAMIIVGEVVRLREELSWFQEVSLTALRQPL